MTCHFCFGVDGSELRGLKTHLNHYIFVKQKSVKFFRNSEVHEVKSREDLMCSAWHRSSNQYLMKEWCILLIFCICNIANTSEF
jgi:hypothetical protein